MTDVKTIDALKPSGCKPAEYDIAAYSCEVPNETDPKDCLKPEFWALVCAPMRLGHELRVVPMDVSWVLRLIVVHKAGTAIKVAQESYTDLTKAKGADAELEPERYAVKYRGRAGWCVIDTTAETDEAMVIEKNHEDRAAAEAALKEYLRMQAA